MALEYLSINFVKLLTVVLELCQHFSSCSYLLQLALPFCWYHVHFLTSKYINTSISD